MLLNLIDVNRQMVPLLQTPQPGVKTDGWFLLGKAYEGLNKKNEAVDAYRHASYWDSQASDLVTAGPNVAFNLAVLLAGQGKNEAAKAAYYWGLRLLAEPTFAEPVPLVIAFEPDPVGEAWTYNLTNLTAAARMGSAIAAHWPGQLEAAENARPDWFLPVAYRALSSSSDKRPQLFDLALTKCLSDRDRQWVNKARAFYLSNHSAETTQALPNGFEIRKTMPVLEKWRLKLVNDHSALSVN